MSPSEARAEAEIAMARIEALAACTDEPGCITRLAFSPALGRANALALGWMRDAGMDARIDAAGNAIGRYEAERPGAPVLMLGSHLDSVRDAGRFDGPLGVVAAISVVERLWRAGRRLPFAVEAIAFADEEGVRFGGTALGSAAVAGVLRPGWRLLSDADGAGIELCLSDFGLDPARVSQAARCETPPLAYVELHIEQGPALEEIGAPLGCVTGIAGATRGRIMLTGALGSGGDALAAAAQCVLAVEQLSAARKAVGTVGSLIVQPGAKGVAFTIDVRAAEDGVRASLVRELLGAFRRFAGERSVGCEFRLLGESSATPCSPQIVAIIGRVLAEMGLPVVDLPSGAGHDGVAMSAIAPIGMVFVRCKGGVSHHPAECVARADVALGLEALSRVCLAVAANPPAHSPPRTAPAPESWTAR